MKRELETLMMLLSAAAALILLGCEDLDATARASGNGYAERNTEEVTADEPEQDAPLRVGPAAAWLEPGTDSLELVAVGGTAPYLWADLMGNATFSPADRVDENHVTYVRDQEDAPGSYVIVVTDSAGDQATVIIELM